MNNYWSQWPKSEIDAMHGVEEEEDEELSSEESDEKDCDEDCRCDYCGGSGCNTCLMIY